MNLQIGATQNTIAMAGLMPISGSPSTAALIAAGNIPNPTNGPFAGVIQIFPAPITLTKMYGTLAMENTIIDVGVLFTIKAQLYKYQNSGGSGTLTAVPGATCVFQTNGTNITTFQDIAPIGLIASCSNTSFSATFAAGDGAYYLITATGVGQGGNPAQNYVPAANAVVPISISMGIAQ